MDKIKIEYVKAEIYHATSIALLHKKGIPTGFLSQQSVSFLTALYSYLTRNEIVYVVKRGEFIIGFIAGTLTTDRLYKKFLGKNWRLLIKFSIENIFSVQFIKKSFETLLAPKKTSLDFELPELLSIVIDESYKGQGLGKQLLHAFEAELLDNKIILYKVLVGKNLEANKFYMNSGFTLKKNIELHKGNLSHIYIKNIEKQSG